MYDEVVKADRIQLLIIIFIGLSPLLRISPESGLLSRDTEVLITGSIISLVLFFSLYHYRVHAILLRALPIFFIICISSFLFGTFAYNIHGLLFWILTLCFGIAIWILRIRKLISLPVISAIFIGCIGIYAQWGIAQFVVQHDLGLHTIGESRIAPGLAGVASFSSSNIKYLRAYGPFAHANSFAGVVLIGTILAYKLKPSSRLYAVSIHLIFILALAVSFSRIAIFGLFILFTIFVIQKRNYRLITPTILIILLFSPILIQRSFDPNGEALHDRTMGIAWMWNMHNPKSLFLGYGPGNYELALQSYTTSNAITYNSWDIAPVHSSPLLLFSELGGLLSIMAILLVSIFFRSYRSIVLIALIPSIIFDHYFTTQLAPAIYLITCALLVVQYKGEHRTD